MNSKGFLKIAFFFVSLLLIALIGLGAYFLGRGDISLNSPLPQTSPEVSLTPVPTPDTESEIEAIEQAVYEKTGLNETQAEVTISELLDEHAKGGVREYEAVGGAYFIAAKKDGEWVCVYDGQANPSCQQIEEYDFPSAMVPECIGTGGELITR